MIQCWISLSETSNTTSEYYGEFVMLRPPLARILDSQGVDVFYLKETMYLCK
jgi:hypothetical protein